MPTDWRFSGRHPGALTTPVTESPRVALLLIQIVRSSGTSPPLPRSRTSILFYHPLYASLVENVNKKARAECTARAFPFRVSTQLVEFRCFERNQNRSTLGTVCRADNAILFHLLNDASCPVVTDAQAALKHARGCGALAPHHV